MKIGHGWRSLLSTLSLAAVVVSMAVSMAIYARIAPAVAGAPPGIFALPALIATSLLGLEFSLCGYLIVRQTGNPVGWLLQGTGQLFSVVWVGLAFNALDVVGRDIGVAGRLAATWLGFGWYPAVILMGVLLPLLFPTGRPPTRRWLWVEVVAAVALVYGLAAVTFETLTGPLEQVLGPESGAWVILTGLLGASVIGSGISVVVRYRRAEAIERLQIKWVVATFVLLCLTVASTSSPLVAYIPPQVAFAVFGLVPVSIFFAITKRRLYDIDRIISRTLSYGVVVGALLGVYVGALSLLTLVLPIQSDLAVAASTLATASLFNPLRRSVHSWVDHRFNRTRYVAQRELDRFVERVNDTAELAAVETDLMRLITRTLEPAGVSLWIRKVVG